MKTTVAVTALAVSLAMTCWAVSFPLLNPSVAVWRARAQEGGRAVRFDDAGRAWLERHARSSESLFQAAVVVLAALWGVVIVKEGYAGLAGSGWREWAAFACGNYLLLISLVGSAIFQLDLAEAVRGPTSATHGTSVTEAPVKGLYWVQLAALEAGPSSAPRRSSWSTSGRGAAKHAEPAAPARGGSG